jgi:hypothetical protein
VVTRLVPLAVGADWSPDPTQEELLWDSEVVVQPDRDRTTTGEQPAAPSAEVQAWATRFAQAVVEVVAGHRPPGQLVRWTSRTVYRDLERRTRLAQRAATAASGMPVQRSTLRPQVRSVHVCRVGAGVAEVSVHVRHGRRSRALAVRLEAVQGRWTCTAMEFA